MAAKNMAHASTLLLIIIVASVSRVISVLPEASQEGLLRPYRSYADVTLFHYYVPREVSLASFQFAAFMDDPGCPTRNVYIFLQPGSYPVVSPDNATYPPHLHMGRTSMLNLTLQSKFKPHDATLFPVNSPLPGSWFAAGYLPNFDQPVQQEGIGHKCQYSLGSIAIWTKAPSMNTIPLETTIRLKNSERYAYYKFYIPNGVWEFNLRIDGCRFHTARRFSQSSYQTSNIELSDSLSNSTNNNATYNNNNGSSSTGDNSSNASEVTTCIQHILLRPRALPHFSTNEGIVSSTSDENGTSVNYTERFPVPDTYYYLVVVTETKVSYNVTINANECYPQLVQKNSLHQIELIVNNNNNASSNNKTKDQAVRNYLNKSEPELLSNELALLEECKCVPIFRLTRIKHAQDFSDTFLLEGKELFTTWLAISDTRSVGVSFELLPYIDIGGTLSVSIHLDEPQMNVSQSLSVTGCIRKGRPPETFCCLSDNITDCCESGLLLHISNANNISKLDDTILIPYPEPDVWFISFTTQCSYDGIRVPCAAEDFLVSMDIRTQPCVLTKPESPNGPILPCGKYGICQEVHKGQFFYTSCRCVGGYRGWACTDDSEAIPEHILLLTTFLLTLSNLFFIPAIVLAIRRRMFTHVLIYLATMISSTLYHACDQDVYGYCVTRYQVLQFCDFFSSILAFWVTLISLGKSPAKFDSVLYMLGALIIAVGVVQNPTGLMVFIVPFCLGIAIPVSIWIYRCVRARAVIKPSLSALLLFIPGVLLGSAGLILFAFVETEDNYRYTHSAWHVIIALSLVYLLPKKKKITVEISGSAAKLEISNSAELAAVNEYQQNNASSPIFFVTSELDHLVHENSR